jgi:urease accessory protein
MKIYTQRLDEIASDQAFETVELSFDTRQKSRFRATLAMALILVRFATYWHFT